MTHVSAEPYNTLIPYECIHDILYCTWQTFFHISDVLTFHLPLVFIVLYVLRMYLPSIILIINIISKQNNIEGTVYKYIIKFILNIFISCLPLSVHLSPSLTDWLSLPTCQSSCLPWGRSGCWHAVQSPRGFCQLLRLVIDTHWRTHKCTYTQLSDPILCSRWLVYDEHFYQVFRLCGGVVTRLHRMRVRAGRNFWCQCWWLCHHRDLLHSSRKNGCRKDHGRDIG